MDVAGLLGDGSIVAGGDAADWRDAIRLAGRALVASGATTSAYTDEMIAAVEQLGPYMVIAPGIALAHSRPSAAVLHAGLSLVTLAHPVEFGNPANDPVSLVIGLAATDADSHVDALAAIADYLADDGRCAALLRATDPSTIRTLVASHDPAHGEATGATA